MRALLRAQPWLLVVALVFSACGRQQGDGPVLPTHQSSSNGAALGRDLREDEARGGHTLKRHVGLSDEQLRQRLYRQPGISAASTYTDQFTAESVIAVAIRENEMRIRQWLNRRGGHPNLVLGYHSERPIGRTLNRGKALARPCSHALVVLKWDGDGEYHVLTSYPECRQ